MRNDMTSKRKAIGAEFDQLKRPKYEFPSKPPSDPRDLRDSRHIKKTAKKKRGNSKENLQKGFYFQIWNPLNVINTSFKLISPLLSPKKECATQESVPSSKADSSFIDDESDVDMQLFHFHNDGSPLVMEIHKKNAITTKRIFEDIHHDGDNITKTIPLGLEINSFLSCSETLEEDMCSNDIYHENTIYVRSSNESENNRSIFALLPDEILLIVFKMLPGSWKDLVRLRTVCKHWNTLIQDNSLKYGKLSEDLAVMIKNEKKHYSKDKIRNYMDSVGVRDISPEMRGILIDWLIEVVEEFRLEGDTLFLCVHYIDRYLSSIEIPITKGKIQLLGVTALLVAAKYEEIYVPTVADIVYIADNTYTKEEVLAMEVNLLNALRFDITVCTIKRFVQYFLKTAEGGLPKSIESAAEKSTLEHLANYISELALVEYRFAIQRPSLVGASAVCLALHVEGLSWTYILESESHYSLNDLNECVQGLWKLFIEAPKSCLQAVYHKYAQSKYGSISTRPPINSLPFNSTKPLINYIS